MKYEAMFEEAENEEELIAALGSPTKLAIGLALNYVPSPAPVSIPVDTVEPGENLGEFAAGVPEEAPGAENVENAEAAAGETAGDEASEVSEEEAPAARTSEETPPAEAALGEEETAAETMEAAEAPVRRRRVRPFGLIVSILFGLIFGVPIALVLILVGVPFLVTGVATVAVAVWSVLTAVPALAMLSDILVVVGAGAVICGLGLLVAWFGLWLSFELGYLWIGGVVLRLGRALTYKKEVAAE